MTTLSLSRRLVIVQWVAGAWLDVTDDVDHVPELGLVDTLTAGRYRFTQVGTVTPPAPAAHVVGAVRALALSPLIPSPARREFRQRNAGDPASHGKPRRAISYIWRGHPSSG